MAQIIVIDGPGVGTTFELTASNTIGRGQHCHIRLESAGVNEEQANISCKGGGYLISPIASGNVLVNGQPVQQERKLIHGDMITLADIMLLYGEESSPSSLPSTKTPPPPAAGEKKDEGLPTVKSRQRFYKDTDAAIEGMGQCEHSTKNMEVLLKVNNAIVSKLEIRDLLQKLLDIMFEQLPADRGTVFLKDRKHNKLWPMATKKLKEIKQTDKLMASRTIVKEVLENKEGVLTRDAMQDDRFDMGVSIAAQNIHAALCVPIVGKNEEVLGVIHLDAVRPNRVFSDDHLKLITAIAMQAALAIENAMMAQQLGEQKRIEQELIIASNIQMQLLPQEVPQVAGIEIFGMMIPAKEVGGDYYDFLTSDDKTQLYVCIGDVSGKGVPAGLVMVMARCFFRPLIMPSRNTKMIMEDLNKFLVADTRKDMFMSMLIIKWDTVEQKFTWTGAGHEHLLVYRAKTKTCETIRAGGIVLGMMKKAERFFTEQELRLELGDTLVLYTDGVTEGLNGKGKMFELNNLEQSVVNCGHLSAEQVCRAIYQEVKQFMGNAPQNDDITLVAIKKK